jgi:hypothetical protein
MNAIRAAAAYRTKLVPANVAEDLTTQKPTMVAAYSASATALYNLENQVKGTLSALAPGIVIETVEFPFYMAYAKWIYRKMRRFPGGAQLTHEVDRYKTIWTARGLNATALLAINGAMGVAAP